MSEDAALPPLRPVTKLYLWWLFAAAASTTFALLAVADHLRAGQIALAVALAAAVTAAYVVPLNGGHRVVHTLETVAILPAIFLLPPGVAMLIAVCGTLIAHPLRSHAWWLAPNLRRMSWAETIFNSSSMALQAGAAALALGLIGWEVATPHFDLPLPILAVGVTGLTIYLVQWVALAGVVSFQERIPLPTVLHDMTIGKQPAE
ncbi:MAG TPA: hypothetical protein VKB09_08570, partial [Thermomicrobiales bacterium]|nr:hypothetical protein [Thermomicrobiales bacterium]